MANLNKVMLMANLTRDPELTYLPSQTAVCRLGLATNRRWTTPDGQQKEEVTFVDADAFGKTAENIAKFFKKGRPIFIEGRLQYRQWEAQDGSKRSKLSVVVENFQFIDSRPAGSAPEGGEAEAGGGGGYAPRPQQARPAFNRPAAGRPAAQAAGAPPAHVDADPPSQAEDEAPPIKEDDIPF